METRTEVRPYEERVEMVGKLTKEFLNSELFKLLAEQEREQQRQIGSVPPPGPQRRPAPPWAHAILDAIWGYFFG